MDKLEVFHFDDNKESFEDFAQINGECHWYATDLMKCLGYDDWRAFDNNAINRAVSACLALKLSVQEHFQQCKRIVEGREIDDYKLTRFACYLIAMNGDPRKPQVAAAQAYFATLADTVRRYLEEVENVERVLIREDISDREKSLSSAAKQAGVAQYDYFQNAGYRGMYNMNLNKLRQRRGIPAGVTPLDYMGKTELAGNLFRITQTEEKM
jgi:DNA-damage-inducible protein D